MYQVHTVFFRLLRVMEERLQECKSVMILLLITIFLSPQLRAENIRYQLKADEGVGFVLRRLGLTPVWPDNGSLEQTMALNPKLKKKYNNFKLPVLTWITLPVAELPESYDYVVHRGVLQFNDYTKKPTIKKKISKALKKVLPQNKNMGDIIVNFHKDSLAQLSPGSQPVVINVNFYNQKEDGQFLQMTAEPIKKKRAVASKPVNKATVEDSFWPEIKAHSFLANLSTRSLKVEGDSIVNNSTAKILSDTSLSLAVDWQQKWSVKYTSALGVDFSQYQVTTIDGSSLVTGDQSTLLSFYFKNYYQFIDDMKIKLNLGYVERYFLDTSSGSTLLTPLSHVQLETGVEYDVFNWGNQFIVAQVNFNYALAPEASFANFDSGIGYGAGLNYSYQLGQEHGLGVGATYGVHDQNSNLFTQTNTELLLMFSYNFWLGGRL